VKDSKIDKSEIELMDNLLNQKKVNCVLCSNFKKKLKNLQLKYQTETNKTNPMKKTLFLPSNTTVKIDLQSNHEEVHRSLFTLEMCRSYY